MILRIEDTDQARFVEGAEEYLIKSLKWLNLRKSVNDSILAYCREGVGFESSPHCVILETLKSVPTIAMSSAWH